ncbi:unnamed protein product, partial [Prorocentrum cordatum]
AYTSAVEHVGCTPDPVVLAAGADIIARGVATEAEAVVLRSVRKVKGKIRLGQLLTIQNMKLAKLPRGAQLARPLIQKRLEAAKLGNH